MYKNLAELACAALAASIQDTGAAAALPTRLDSANKAVVADTCVRDNLGFALLFHRRKDGLVADELYFSTREDDGTWAAAEHLSGGVTEIEPTSPRNVAAILKGRSMVLYDETETDLPTGRPQADEGYELLRSYALLVDPETDHLDIENTTPGADPAAGRTRKTLTSQVALFALFSGERFTIHPVARNGSRSQPLGEPYELTGPDPGPGPELPRWLADLD
ncbi:hypothetical protein ACFW5D_36300 [Streptomyces sp. NPDC058770]|uniref:hypothetical protein n=1 Tax=Streptomyces sp. NPDC058770 TaxID=3346631 RepID=UPI0036AB4BAE